MAEGMMIRGQKAEDRRQNVVCRYAARFGRSRGAAATKLLSSDGTTSHSTWLAKNASQIAGYVFCLLSSVLCHAEELTDPTRPPAVITVPATTAAGSAPSGLQSIIISKTRRAAIIDGETVELRGKHGDATLIEINENGVVLQGAQGRQVLTLFPDVKIMQKEIQATPKLSEKEGGLAQKTKLEARKERK